MHNYSTVVQLLGHIVAIWLGLAILSAMLNEHFVILGAVFNLLGVAGYVWATLQGRTKPNRITWFLWALAPLIAFAAELDEGVGLRSLMTFMVGFGPAIVFLVSLLDRKAYWKLTAFDILCGLFSLLALILWKVTGTGTIAIILSIAADCLAGTPTFVKAYKRPDTETGTPFLGGAVSAAITLLTLKRWSLAAAGFPVYICLTCVYLYAVIAFPNFLRPRHAGNKQ